MNTKRCKHYSQYPIKAKYPPTTGRGRYATISATFNRPATISTAPRHVVDSPNRTIVVDKTSSSVPPSLIIEFAILLLIADKNMSPASCTWPIENGKEEKILKQN